MATWMGTALASGEDSGPTGALAAQQAITRMGHHDKIKLCIVYANADYDLQAAVNAIRHAVGDIPLIGCSSTGEFTSDKVETGAIVVTTIASDQMEIRLSSAQHYSNTIPDSVTKVVSGLQAHEDSKGIVAGWRGRTLLLFTDGLAGHGEELIDELMMQTGMQYQLFGGAAADNVKFQKTYIFHNDEVLTDAFVVAEILSEKPFGISADHGWHKLEGPFRVTRAEANIIYELNGQPAWEIYKNLAEKQSFTIPQGSESAFLMQYILGVKGDPTEKQKLRVPLALNSDGSLLCAAEIFEGDIVDIMTSNNKDDIIEGGRAAIEKAKKTIASPEYAGALVFECVATRLHLGSQFAEQVHATADAVQSADLMGCACFGQLARTLDDFSGQGCATSLVCLIPA